MKYNPNQHHRRSIRLKGYDYSQSGAYFVTLRTQKHHPCFGEIEDGIMILNDAGLMVQNIWLTMAQRFPHIQLDQFVVMPDHFHGIIVIDGFGGNLDGADGVRKGDHKDADQGDADQGEGDHKADQRDGDWFRRALK